MGDFKRKPYLSDKDTLELDYLDIMKGVEGGNTYRSMMATDKRTDQPLLGEMRKPYLGDEFREMERIPRVSAAEVGVLCAPCGSLEWDYENSDETVARNSTAVLIATGCVDSEYTWSVSGVGFTLAKNTTGPTNILVADGTSCGSAIITITEDCDGSSAIGYVRNTTGQWVEIARDSLDTRGVVAGIGQFEGGNHTSYWLTQGGYRLYEDVDLRSSSVCGVADDEWRRYPFDIATISTCEEENNSYHDYLDGFPCCFGFGSPATIALFRSVLFEWQC